MKLSTKIILPIILISALLILLAGCLPDDSPGYTPGAISGTIARPEVCCGEPSESYLVGNPIPDNICDDPYIYGLCNTQHTADWYAWANVEVTLTTWIDCEEVEIASTMTDENGEYLFSDVPSGKNYIITAICPEEKDFVVKDVAEEVVEGETYDAGIADAESTVLALCLEGLGEICLDSYLLDLNDFRNHSKYEIVICEVCDKLAECLHAIPVWVCEITELCGPGYVPTGDDDGDDDDDDECVSSPTADAGSDQEGFQVCDTEDVVSVDFTGSGTGFGTLSYSWDFDNGGSTEDSTEQSPQGVAFYVGDYTVILTVTDECNNSATDETIVTVTITECINHAPEISNIPPASVQKVDIYQTYTYDVDATDVDVVDTLTYSLTVNPNGMVIDPSTGVITWTYANCDGETETKMSSLPTKGDRCHKLCDIPVTVKVTDDGCCGHLFDEESFIVEVWQP